MPKAIWASAVVRRNRERKNAAESRSVLRLDRFGLWTILGIARKFYRRFGGPPTLKWGTRIGIKARSTD